jgi:hypothetical protein
MPRLPPDVGGRMSTIRTIIVTMEGPGCSVVEEVEVGIDGLRRPGALFSSGDHDGADDAHGLLQSGIAANRGAHRLRRRAARPRSQCAGLFDNAAEAKPCMSRHCAGAGLGRCISWLTAPA